MVPALVFARPALGTDLPLPFAVAAGRGVSPAESWDLFWRPVGARLGAGYASGRLTRAGDELQAEGRQVAVA